MVPVVDVGFRCLDQLQLLVGIIDECAQLALFRFAQRVAEEVVYLTSDVARCVLEHMTECLVLAMNVGKKMLGAFGQVENGLKVDDLRACCRYRGERL